MKSRSRDLLKGAEDQGNVSQDFLPKISAVVPAYNAAAYIVKTLDSVQVQTYPAHEIVLVDDGSVDRTSDLVARWAADHPDIRVNLVRQDNRGIGAARNAGIWRAVGEYVAFLDADDLWWPRKLETVARRFAEAGAPDLICHDEQLEGTGRKPRRLTHGPYTTYYDLLFRGNPLSPSATVVRREKLREVGGFSEDLRLNSAEDYDLWLRLAKAGCRMEYVHEVLGTFRQDGQGITSNIEMHCEHCLRVLDLHYEAWTEKTPYCRYLIRKRRAAVLRGACREFLHRGDCRQAQRLWRRSLAAHPLSFKTWALAATGLAFLKW